MVSRRARLMDKIRVTVKTEALSRVCHYRAHREKHFASFTPFGLYNLLIFPLCFLLYFTRQLISDIEPFMLEGEKFMFFNHLYNRLYR